ncbi:unnamed protein product [Cylindrotheca closterium]|uniref:Uncharacterized protein n=1 Tax=Cylindrotheca closterium TaxID=2856 RepID=A0AAD2PV63_9STRA|nr:unnamed protein product [Cylindrotheca closterium]
MLSSLSNTGSVDRQGVSIGGSQAQFEVMAARLDKLEKENASLKEKVGKMEVKFQSEPKKFNAPSMMALVQQLQMRMASVEIKDLEQITVGGHAFGGVQDCVVFLETKMVFTGGFFGHDVVSMMNPVGNESKSSAHDDILVRDKLAIKGGFDNISAANLYTSMQKPLPRPFSGPGQHPLPALSTFDKWDKQDGIHGIRYTIDLGVEQEVNQSIGWIRSELMLHPEAMMVFTTLVYAAQSHWNKIATFLTELRQICKQQSDDDDQAWVYLCEVVKGLFTELHRIQSAGAARKNLGKLTVEDAGRMMWSVLRCHRLMDDFISHKFLGHPKLSGYSLSHLFRHRLTPKNLEPIKGQVEQLKRELAAVNVKLTKKKDKGT